MYSLRLPEKLIAELDLLAKTKGWTSTDLIITALDQYVQWEKKNR
jgi:predicted transcriptional regulator